jgi:ophiobolin F synthase
MFQLVQTPYDYINSMPSKGFRAVFIDAMNIWFNVSDEMLDCIKKITGLLHTASLMYDAVLIPSS